MTAMTMMKVGGKYSRTAALKNALAAQGNRAPHTGQPFSEAMLLGIGGGLGAGYILWEFKAHESAIIVMGFVNRWNYPTERLMTLCERLGVKASIQETAGRKAADANLEAALKGGGPLLAWVDKAHLPYQALPESLKGYVSHVVGVHGSRNGALLIDDLADGLFSVPAGDFAAARGRIGSDKNRLLLVDSAARIDLEGAILAGLEDHVAHLSSDSESFSLPVYKKWAKMLTDTRNKKGWPIVFKERKGLYTTLRSIYEGIALDGTEGSALRSLYADFLEEAAPVVKRPALKQAAQAYRNAAAVWIAFADAALPDSIPALRDTRALMRQRYAHYQGNQLDDMRPVSEKLLKMQGEYDRAFPVNDAGVSTLFADLQSKLTAIHDAEVEALEALRKAL